MDKSWDFDCPQFVDFSGADLLADDDKAEQYFEYDHESGVPVQPEEGTPKQDPGSTATENDVYETPSVNTPRVTRSASRKTPVAAVANEKSHRRSTPRTGKSVEKTSVQTVEVQQETPDTQRVTRAAKVKTPAVEVEVQQETPDTQQVTRAAKVKTPAVEVEVQQETPNTQRVTRAAQVKTPAVEVEVQQETPDTQRATRAAKVKTPAVEEPSENKPSVKRANVCTNLNEWKKKTANSKQAEGQSTKEPEANKKVQELKTTSTKRQHRSLDRSESLSKKQKTDNQERGRTPSKTTGVQRSCSFSTLHNKSRHTRGYSGEPPQRQRTGSSSSNKSDSDKSKVHVTVPTTPTFMKRKPVKLLPQEPVKTAEERELDKIAFYRKELAKKRKEAQESCKLALAPKGPTSVPVIKEPTKPQEFKFETDSRIKTHAMETRTDYSNKNFESTLRSDKDKQPTNTAKTGVTVPEPFHLTAQRKRKLPDLDEKQAEKYETMAQRIKAFTATPERFRSKPRAQAEQKRGRSKSPPHGVTIPKTPQFETKSRLRPVTAPSRDELENRELEEVQKHQFKANPVNHRILNNPNCGVKKVPSKPLTVVEEFHLTSNNKRLDKQQEKEEQFEFHAQPLNKKILEGPVGLRGAKKMPLTVPESPAFALKHRARLPQEPEAKQDEKPVLRSRAPHYGIPFQPQLQHKTTQPEPFAFEERDKWKAEEKMRHIEQVIEEENRLREFHANPLPDNEVNLPPKKVKPLTVKQPFNLDTDKRGMKKAEEWSHKLEEELRHQKEMARFKANEPVVLEKQPFVPIKDTKFTTEFTEFELETAKRVSKREVYEMHLKQKQDQIDNIRRQEKLMKEAEEAAEIERLRREAVHKANPVKNYKPIRLKPSEKPLTTPMSPVFRTDDRLRTRAQHSSSILSN